jgi:hypothetical protein
MLGLSLSETPLLHPQKDLSLSPYHNLRQNLLLHHFSAKNSKII